MTDSKYTHVGFVIDRSGSMSGIAQDMNGGIRQTLDDLAKQEGVIKVDVATFDNDVEFVYTDAHPSDITSDLVVPRGSTALNDAIGQMITRLGNKFKTMPEEKRPSTVIVVVVTDGMENASREYKTVQIKAMVEEQTGKWNWTFTYLAANVDAFATGAAYGFAPGQTMSYAASGSATRKMSKGMSANISRTIAGDSTGYLATEREDAVAEDEAS
jgi:uncharacterized protein YegL